LNDENCSKKGNAKNHKALPERIIAIFPRIVGEGKQHHANKPALIVHDGSD
jgi:hypothetical protein